MPLWLGLNISYRTLHYEQKLLGSANWVRQLRRTRRTGPWLVTPTPRTETHMSEIRNFAARLAIADKRFLINKRYIVRCVWWTNAAENANLINKPVCEGGEKRLWSANQTTSKIAPFGDRYRPCYPPCCRRRRRKWMWDLTPTLAYLIFLSGLFFPLIWGCRRHQELVRCQSHPADHRPALFAKFCGLLPLPKGVWVWVSRNVIAETFAATFRHWLERCKSVYVSTVTICTKKS